MYRYSLTICLFLVVNLTSLSVGKKILKSPSTFHRRWSKGGKGWSDHFEPWSPHPHGHCDCDCKKKTKTVAIVIPKYKFVEIPIAKHVKHKVYETGKKVELHDEHEGMDEHEYEGHDEKYGHNFDAHDEHDHEILDAMHMKRSENASANLIELDPSAMIKPSHGATLLEEVFQHSTVKKTSTFLVTLSL